MIEEVRAFENRILETLNTGNTARHFMQVAVELLAEALDILVLQVFRKDDYAVKYAVEPLLAGTGPLAELPVRLKLVYALGLISRGEYEDAELLMALCDELLCDDHDYQFTDDEILGPLGELHCVAALPAVPVFWHADEADLSLMGMQQQRYQQILHSTLVLSVTALIAGISSKNVARLSPVPRSSS